MCSATCGVSQRAVSLIGHLPGRVGDTEPGQGLSTAVIPAVAPLCPFIGIMASALESDTLAGFQRAAELELPGKDTEDGVDDPPGVATALALHTGSVLDVDHVADRCGELVPGAGCGGGGHVLSWLQSKVGDHVVG